MSFIFEINLVIAKLPRLFNEFISRIELRFVRTSLSLFFIELRWSKWNPSDWSSKHTVMFFTLKVFRSDGNSLTTYTNICCNSPFFQSLACSSCSEATSIFWSIAERRLNILVCSSDWWEILLNCSPFCFVTCSIVEPFKLDFIFSVVSSTVSSTYTVYQAAEVQLQLSIYGSEKLLFSPCQKNWSKCCWPHIEQIIVIAILMVR